MKFSVDIKSANEDIFAEKSLESYKQEELIREARKQFEILLKRGLQFPVSLA